MPAVFRAIYIPSPRTAIPITPKTMLLAMKRTCVDSVVSVFVLLHIAYNTNMIPSNIVIHGIGFPIKRK